MNRQCNEIDHKNLCDRVLSDNLPDWAKETSEGNQDSSHDTGWVDRATETETQTNDTRQKTGGSTQSHKQAASIAICQSECQSCGTTTIRGHHPGCKAPIISISGDWRCGECGVEITPQDTCFECGVEFTHSRIDIPLDYSPQIDRAMTERAVHKETNRYRTQHNLETLEYSSHLSCIALKHSRDMAERDFFDHVCPDGNDAGDRYRHFDHDDRSSGENIACIYPDHEASVQDAAQSVVNDWMNSKGHRENILRDRFNQEGIGIYFTSEGAMYATQNFY
jgi:uncharacterized protein YkwD